MAANDNRPNSIEIVLGDPGWNEMSRSKKTVSISFTAGHKVFADTSRLNDVAKIANKYSTFAWLGTIQLKVVEGIWVVLQNDVNVVSTDIDDFIRNTTVLHNALISIQSAFGDIGMSIVVDAREPK